MGTARPEDMMQWQQTVVAHGSWLRAVIAARLDPGEPVDDLLQETLRSAIERGRPDGALRDVKAWLAGIARNKVRQHIDRNCRDRRLRARVAEEPSSSPLPLPDEFLLHGERVTLVKDALAELGEREATLLRCKYFQGWSYARIGRELHLSEIAVTNGLRRARALLRERIHHHLSRKATNDE